VYHNFIVNFILIVYPSLFSGIVKSCVPIENHKIIDRKLELLANDIEKIENRLRSFLGDHFLYYDFDTRDQILLLIDLIKVCY